MTKAQRAAKAKRAGAVRRKANAVKVFMRKMNPGKKPPTAVRVKRLKGGGIQVTPLKINAGPLSFRKSKKAFKKSAIWKRGGGGKVHEEWLKGYVRTQKRTTGHRGTRRRRAA